MTYTTIDTLSGEAQLFSLTEKPMHEHLGSDQAKVYRVVLSRKEPESVLYVGDKAVFLKAL